MKTIRWVGAALAAVTAIAGILMIGLPGEAAVGDAIEPIARAEVTFSAGQRNCVRDWILLHFPASDFTKIDVMECAWDGGVRGCIVSDMLTLTAAEYVAREAAGTLPREALASEIAVDGTATMPIPVASGKLTAAQNTGLDECLAAFTSGTYNGVTLDKVSAFRLRRSGSTVFGTATILEVKAPLQRMLDKRSGTRNPLAGIVTQ
jgi:hypothetical protein